MNLHRVTLSAVVALVFAAASLWLAFAPAPAQIRTTAPRTPNRTLQATQVNLRRLPPWRARKLYKGLRRNWATASGVINYVVVVIMENRTLDNLFSGYYGQRFDSQHNWEQVVDIAKPSDYGLQSISLATAGDPNHSHAGGFAVECNYNSSTNSCNPTISSWMSENVGCPGNSNCGTTALSYVQRSDTNIYANLVKKYAFADEVYQANQGPSFPAHQYLIAGQSGGINEQGSAYPPLAMVENTSSNGDPVFPTPAPGWSYNDPEPYNATQPGGFCGNAQALVHVLNMTQHYADALSGEQGNGRLHPCQDYPTIFDRLAGSIQPLPFAWEYHAHQSYGFWSAPMAIQHFAYYQGGGPITNFVVDPDAVNYINTEAPSGNVASVTYLTPCPYDSDHPNETTTSGPKWVASILNAIGGNTNLWNQTAVFIVWDDWGGWFDHDSNIFSPNNVYPNGGGPPPNQIDPNEWGFRVPMIIVSPYVKQSGYISHTTRSFSAILNFIEWNWYLQSLNADDVADANYLSRPGDNLTDAFDFTRSPMQWSPISVGGYVPASPCPTP